MAKFRKTKQKNQCNTLAGSAFFDKMKALTKKIRAFPWDLIYVPLFWCALMIWGWETYTGDDFMDFIEAILTWAGVNAQTIVGITVISSVVLSGLYTIAKWFATNKNLKKIDKNTAVIPSVKKTMDKIDEKASLIPDVIKGQSDIKRDIDKSFQLLCSSTNQISNGLNMVLNSKNESLTPQGQVFSEIAQVYTQYSKATQRIEELEAENALLKERVQYLSNELSRNKRLSRDELEL